MARASTSRRVERLLARAHGDRALREDLVARRSAAAQEHGFELDASERAMIDALPETQLRDTIERLGPVAASRDADAVLMGGIRPDEPLPGEERSSPVRGHSSCLTVAAATGAVVLAGGAIAASCLTAGARADMPPEPDRPATTSEPGRGSAPAHSTTSATADAPRLGPSESEPSASKTSDEPPR